MIQTLERPTLLLDDYLGDYDETRIEHLVTVGRPDDVYEVVRALDLLTIQSPMLDALMWLRTAPAKIAGKELPPPPSMALGGLFDDPVPPSVDQPWVPLAEERGEELVFGVVGKFWQPSITWLPVPSDRFASFDEPGWGKIAASISVQPYGRERSLMTYEARTRMTDEASRAKFHRYWKLMSPFIGFVMRALLKDVSRRM